MEIASFGINFKTAPLLIRERVAKEIQPFLHQYPAVWISTCNRVEVYTTDDEFSPLYSLFLSIDSGLKAYTYCYRGQECFLHLCHLAAGLDSAILGETEIVRQMKMAYLSARSLPGCLHYAFQKALHVAKINRHRFPFVRETQSLSKTLWQITQEFFPSTSHLKILLVGFSQTHREWASFLRYKGMDQIVFCSRSQALPMEHLRPRKEVDSWRSYDVISCATQAESFLIRGRSDRKHLLFDLSMPRLIDPNLEGRAVSLWNLDAIHARMETHKEEKMEKIKQAIGCLEEHACRLFSLYEEKTKSLHALGI